MVRKPTASARGGTAVFEGILSLMVHGECECSIVINVKNC